VQRLDRDEWGPADEALAESAATEGHAWCEDHNAPAGTGISPYGISARDGARVTTNDGYLEPARERENLRVLGGATVDQVLLEADQATGVRARLGGEWVEIRTEKVVLCAGAIGSPAILLRSGIGPAGPAVRLPVGQHMQEHPLALFWLFHRLDAYQRLDTRQTNCCVRYSSGLEGAGVNDMMIVSVNQTLALPEDARSPLVGEQAGTWGGAGGGQAPGGPGLLCLWINEQFGRGRLALASPDPDVPPLIDQDLLNVEADRVRMRDGVKRSLELLRSGSFAPAFEHIAIDMSGRGLDALCDDRAIDAWLMDTIGDTESSTDDRRSAAPNHSPLGYGPGGRGFESRRSPSS
jgi:choline dehydrogenase/5-(hydroxymethyl)furfural/furfural oxidase